MSIILHLQWITPLAIFVVLLILAAIDNFNHWRNK